MALVGTLHWQVPMGRLGLAVPSRYLRARRRPVRVALSLWAAALHRLALAATSVLLSAPALATRAVPFRFRPAYPQPVQVVACYSLPETGKQQAESFRSPQAVQQPELAVVSS